jgi:capsular exopolysaccharide synthesis family protein
VVARQPLPAGEELVDLRKYTAVLRRRAPIIIVLTLVGFSLMFGYSKLQTPKYTARAKVLVNPPPGTDSQSPDRVISMDTEAQVLESQPIAVAAGAILKSPLTVQQLLKRVSATTAPENFIMNIAYVDPSPTRAALGANAFATAYVDYKTQQARAQISQAQGFVTGSIQDLVKKQRALNADLVSQTPGSLEYRSTQDQLDRLSVELVALESQLGAIPQVVNPDQIILQASAPASPSSPKVPLNSAIGLMLGLFCGVVAAFVLDLSDDRVRGRVQLESYLEAPLLAYVPHSKSRDHRRRNAHLVVDLEPRGPAAEAYRTMRTNVMSMARKRGLKVFAVVSPMPQEGKSMTAANLAAALGQTDERVLVVSADIRKPRIHEHFGVSNGRGLTEVLEGELAVEEAIVRPAVGNVWVLPGGHITSRPAELLQSSAMAELLDTMRTEFDLVILDCPPVLGLSDCLALLPLVDAVLLVVRSGHTRGGAILETTDQLERVGVRVDAAILTDVDTPRRQHYGYGYYLASSEYLRPEKKEPPQRWGPRLISPAAPVEAKANGNGASGEAESDVAISNGTPQDEIVPEPVVSGADEL